jgi:hypothetical protein
MTPTSDQEHGLPNIRDAGRLLVSLRASLAHHQVVESKELAPLLAYVAGWQSLRLARTHHDMLVDPQFSQACRFFLADIYAPKDFSQRNYDGTRIYDFMNKLLPEATLYPLAVALELNGLTAGLDRRLAQVMEKQMGLVDSFTMAQYMQAYRLCDNYQDRIRQIDLILEVGKHLERVRHFPFIGTTLRLARRPAQRLGWHDMQGFLERGFAAWRSLRQPQHFLSNIERRERAILNHVYGKPGGSPTENPFLVSDGGPAEIVLVG